MSAGSSADKSVADVPFFFFAHYKTLTNSGILRAPFCPVLFTRGLDRGEKHTLFFSDED